MSRICSFCVMDESDPDITFDVEGRCKHCRAAIHRLEHETFRAEKGETRLRALVDKIKADGRGKEYDAVIGVSGGLDSSYTALVAKELGLRALVVHLDNGWNSELAVRNIEKVVDGLGFDLYTHVVNWEEIKDLHRAFFLASVANVEVVTDHAIYACLYKEAAKRNIRTIINGSNVTGETIMPPAWGYEAKDSRHLVGIHKLFGKRQLKTFPILHPAMFVYHTIVQRIKWIPVLNYVCYNTEDAIRRLQQELDWAPYARKHGESRFTKFFQEYYLPEKFGVDKRRAHYSSLICSGQMRREVALAELKKPMSEPGRLSQDIEYVRKKLDFSESEFDAIMMGPIKTHRDYPNFSWAFDFDNILAAQIRRIAKAE